jgi:hypothetical protein
MPPEKTAAVAACRPTEGLVDVRSQQSDIFLARPAFRGFSQLCSF